MTLSVLCVGVSVGALAMTTVTYAATPITLPFGDFSIKGAAEIHLPLPPPPQVERPDVTQMRLVIKRQPMPVRGGCESDARPAARPPAGRRRRRAPPPGLRRHGRLRSVMGASEGLMGASERRPYLSRIRSG